MKIGDDVVWMNKRYRIIRIDALIGYVHLLPVRKDGRLDTRYYHPCIALMADCEVVT